MIILKTGILLMKYQTTMMNKLRTKHNKVVKNARKDNRAGFANAHLLPQRWQNQIEILINHQKPTRYKIRGNMNTISISLRPITRDNWKQCITLDVQPRQKNLIGANVKSLAEASVRPEATTLGIFVDDEMAGFMMYLRDIEDGYYYIHRFMVDAKYQRRGIGYMGLKQT